MGDSVNPAVIGVSAGAQGAQGESDQPSTPRTKAKVEEPHVLGTVSAGSEHGNSPLAGAGVALDGAGAALSAMTEQLDVVVGRSPEFARTYVARIRPWRDFFPGVDLPEEVEEVPKRIETNVVYFAANYSLMLVVFVVVMLLSHPRRLSYTLAVLAVWGIYARCGGLDPDWKPTLLGSELGSTQRLYLLFAASLLFLFVVCGDLVLMIIGLAGVFTFLHAACHASAAPAVATYSPVTTRGSDID